MLNIQKLLIIIVLIVFPVVCDSHLGGHSGYYYAKKYIGYTETKNTKELKRILGINPIHIAWCSAFITAMERRAGHKGTGDLLARSYLKYGFKVPINDAKLGDIVVFKRGKYPHGHVGYFVRFEGNNVVVLGGNQDNSVKYSIWSQDKILGVRRHY